MSQYKTGTAAVTNGSAIVAGTGTAWLANVTPGDGFTIAGTNVPYTVGSVDTDTQITLSAPYSGTTGSGLTYAIWRDFTNNYNLPELFQGDIEAPTLLTRAMRLIDSAPGAAVADHEAKPDPHPQYLTDAEADAAYEQKRLNNLSATTDPTVNDDSGAGYEPLSRWINTSTGEIWLCVSASVGAANWQKASLTIDELGALALANNATDVPYSNSTSGLTATQVQAALDEIDGDLDTHIAAGDPHPQYALESALAADTGAGTVGTGSGNNLQQEMDQRIGAVSIALAGTDVTLTAAQVSAQIITLTGTLTANVNIIVPDADRQYTFVNTTSGSFTVTAKTSLGSGVDLPQGQLRSVRSDGTNVVTGEGFSDFPTTPKLNGKDIYAQSNILGAVSESAGVPTGAIIESGSNANGEYVKFADGTMITTSQGTLDLTTGSARSNRFGSTSGDMYFVDLTMTHPATFVTTPEGYCSVSDNAGHVANYQKTASSASQAVTRTWSYINTGTLGISLIGIGRWF